MAQGRKPSEGEMPAVGAKAPTTQRAEILRKP
jgi:hypothetical protein